MVEQAKRAASWRSKPVPVVGPRPPVFGAGVDDGTATMMHVDMDAFYASVELLEHPELTGKAVIIGHPGGRGVVTTATYEARRFGVHSAMPMSRALQLCPHAVILPPRMQHYKHFSNEVMRIFRDVTPLVEPLSIDEAFLDVSGARRLLGTALEIGTLLRARVEAETGLTCSVGAAATKFVAKMASSHAKPNGMLVVPAAQTLVFLHPLAVNTLWGVGATTTEALNRLGIRTIGDLAATPLETLTRRVGEASGHKLHQLANGIDSRSVVTERQEKSVGHEVTFEHDVADSQTVRLELLRQSDQVAVRLRRAGLAAKTVSLKLRFTDFTTITRSRTLSEPTDLAQTISDSVRELFFALGPLDQRVRLIGVRAENLVEASETVHQPSLWADESAASDDWRTAEVTVDAVASKFGAGILRRASLVEKGPAPHPSRAEPTA